MQRIEVAPGNQYGDLTVLKEVDKQNGKRMFLCKCACGQKASVRLGHLRSGHSTTCGKCGVLFKGQRKSLRQWASLYGMNESTLRARLKTMGMKEALGKG